MDKERLLEEFARRLDYWVKEGVSASSDSEADLMWSEHRDSFLALQQAVAQGAVQRIQLQRIFEEVLRGFAVSLFTVIDGGTQLAEERRIFLVDEEGEPCGEIHDEFVMHLFRTGRLK